MNYDEINSKLNQIKMEDYIWIIYLLIIALSYYSNNLERNYFIYNDLNCKEKYREIMILIFTILVIIYFYFFKGSLSDINNLKPSDSQEKKNLVYLSSISSLLITVSGIIFLYIALKDEDINIELAFN